MYLLCNGERRIEVKRFQFTGGEIHVKIPTEPNAVSSANTINLVSKIQSPADLIEVLLVNDAVRRMNPNAVISATFPYFPYARQDRVCVHGEALSVKVAADMINSCNFATVRISDPHSDVTPALINNVQVWEQHHMVLDMWGEIKREYGNAIIVSPDAGANKKILKVVQALGKDTFIRADKIRDVENGQITETVVYGPKLNGESVLIIDDICDGGNTFIALAQALKDHGAGKVGLYVSHGIFSRGLDVLLKNGIDHIYSQEKW